MQLCIWLELEDDKNGIVVALAPSNDFHILTGDVLNSMERWLFLEPNRWTFHLLKKRDVSQFRSKIIKAHPVVVLVWNL